MFRLLKRQGSYSISAGITLLMSAVAFFIFLGSFYFIMGIPATAISADVAYPYMTNRIAVEQDPSRLNNYDYQRISTGVRIAFGGLFVRTREITATVGESYRYVYDIEGTLNTSQESPNTKRMRIYYHDEFRPWR